MERVDPLPIAQPWRCDRHGAHEWGSGGAGAGGWPQWDAHGGGVVTGTHSLAVQGYLLFFTFPDRVGVWHAETHFASVDFEWTRLPVGAHRFASVGAAGRTSFYVDGAPIGTVRDGACHTLVPSPHCYRRNRTITQPCRLRARTTWDGTLATRLVRAPPCHIYTGTGPTPATAAPGLRAGRRATDTPIVAAGRRQ